MQDAGNVHGYRLTMSCNGLNKNLNYLTQLQQIKPLCCIDFSPVHRLLCNLMHSSQKNRMASM